MVLLLLVSLYWADWAGDTAAGGLLGSSGCSVEISALVFCSIVLRGGGVLRGCLLPCSAVVGAWSLCLAEVAGDSWLYIPSL